MFFISVIRAGNEVFYSSVHTAIVQHIEIQEYRRYDRKVGGGGKQVLSV